VTDAGSGAVRLGTRGSALALAQAELVSLELARRGVKCVLEVITTAGDLRAADTAWGEGAFVGAIERALLDGRIDMAVHSAKDVPIDHDPRLALVAFLERAEPRDALVVGRLGDGLTLDELPVAATLGTDSPRRAGFVRAQRPDLDIRPLHGNVDTRLHRLDDGVVDGLILAAAGLARLGRSERVSQLIPAEQLPPAPGQGALCLQVRADDSRSSAIGAELDHRPTRLAVEAERAFLAAAGGGCRSPLGALATLAPGRLCITGGVVEVDGHRAVVETVEGAADDGPALALELAERVLGRRRRSAVHRRVILTRPAGAASSALRRRLEELGVAAVAVPAIEIVQAAPGGPLDDALGDLAGYGWAVATSVNGVAAAAAAADRLGLWLGATRWAAVGTATARELGRRGVDAWLPSRAAGQTLAAELPMGAAERVALIRGALSGEELPSILRQRGAVVDEVVAYHTVEAPPDSVGLLEAALEASEPIAAVVYASPSQVRGLLALAGERHGATIRALPAMCIGPTTAAAARASGLTVVGEAPMQNAVALAELTAELIGQSSGGRPAAAVGGTR